MKLTHAVKSALYAFKTTWTQPGPNYYTSEGWRMWDALTNGWAAVSASWDSFWTSLREWGGIGYKELADAAAANPHAGRGLRLICEAGAAVPLIGYRGEEEVPSLELMDVIERSRFSDLWSAFVWGQYCGGEVFLHRLTAETGPNRGRAVRIRALRNERFVKIERDRTGEPTSYVFSVPGTGRTESFKANEVLHIRSFNPRDPERGMPMLISARRALTLVEEADAWNRGISKGGGRVPAYFKPVGLAEGQTIKSEDVLRSQQLSDEKHRERASSNLPMFLNGAYEPFTVGISPKDADWLKGRQVAMREIAAVLGVPATLLADEKGGSLTDAGVDSEIAALYKLTVVTMVDWFLTEISEWLAEGDEEVRADWDQVPALQEDQDAKFKRYEGATEKSIVTIKEARVALGYDPNPAPDMVDEKPEPIEPPEEERRLRLVDRDSMGELRTALRAHFKAGVA